MKCLFLFMLKNLHHILDIHMDPIAQKSIASIVKELYSMGEIQALFCENITSDDFPISMALTLEKMPIDVAHYFRELKNSDIPVYGVESRELHSEYIEILQELVENDNGQRSLKNLLTIIPREIRVKSKRDLYFLKHINKISEKERYSNVALVTGDGHQKGIEKLSSNLNWDYHLHKCEISEKSYHEQVLKNLFPNL